MLDLTPALPCATGVDLPLCRVHLSQADFPERFSFPDEEKKILELWEKLDAFKTSLRLSENKPPYTFYDGPPFATGLPHYGHILAGTIKDTITRYATQTGHYVSRRFVGKQAPLV